MRVFFDLPHLYYLPQYAPVWRELRARGIEGLAVVHRGGDEATKQASLEELELPHRWVQDGEEAMGVYAEQAPEWVVFGNDVSGLERLAASTRSALLFHGSGTGVKRASLSPALAELDVRFVSGPGRMPIFREHYPDVELVEVGFAKLDPLRSEEGRSALRLDLEQLGLDPDRATVLYAPTFYPSSIENMSPDFPEEFGEMNVLIKAHDFTLNKPRYRRQRERLERFSRAENVYLARQEEYSLLPFLATADVMATDTSSAIFECASLDKPVLTCDFVRLRWTYRGPLRYRLRRRLDPTTQHYLEVAESVRCYEDLLPAVRRHLDDPALLRESRLRYAEEIMGPLDGRASERVADHLQHRHEPRATPHHA